MTKVMIEVPDNLHRLVKSVASAKGETMKSFVIKAMERMIQTETNSTTPQDSISEEEADNMLKPYLSSLVDSINNGTEEVMESEEFFKKLEEDNSTNEN